MQAQSLSCNTAAEARRLYPLRFTLWTKLGLSPRAASALALAGCDTAEQAFNLGRDWFAGQPNVGTRTLNELALVASWPPPQPKNPVDAISAALLLSISDPEEARDAAQDAVIGLRRAGFVIAARRSLPAGGR